MNEQISALTDDEILSDDAKHLITAIQCNKQAADTWSHYHLIGDTIRGTPAFSADFKTNLMLKLEEEPTVLSPNATLTAIDETKKTRLDVTRKIPAGWSVAASFAAVMLVGWMVMNQQTQNVNTLTPIEMAQNATDIPAEYLMVHQASAPSNSAYYIQSVGYTK